MIQDCRRAVSIAWSLARRINYGLRAYDGDQGIEWPTVEYSPMPGLATIRIQGCDPACAHEWANEPAKIYGGGKGKSTLNGGDGYQNATMYTTTQGAYCIHCGGWRGPLGLEPTIEAYIGHLILVVREMWRVLRTDGTLFFNLGDSYAANRSYQVTDNKHVNVGNNHGSSIPLGLKPKDMLMIPARFALAAQADGWYLRSAMPWIKRNGMPESVTDRPAQTIESVFILAKAERYFWDSEAVKMPNSSTSHMGGTFGEAKKTDRVGNGHSGLHVANNTWDGRNLRSSDLFFRTWEGLLSSDEGNPLAMVINPRGYSGAHFAVFPELLPELAIKAATSAYGCCPTCGAQWRRVVEKTDQIDQSANGSRFDKGKTSTNGQGRTQEGERFTNVTTGWAPGCECPDAAQVQPAIVLDPFSGSGTTARVALRLGRNAIGVDLAESYLEELAPERLSNVQMVMSL